MQYDNIPNELLQRVCSFYVILKGKMASLDKKTLMAILSTITTLLAVNLLLLQFFVIFNEDLPTKTRIGEDAP